MLHFASIASTAFVFQFSRRIFCPSNWKRLWQNCTLQMWPLAKLKREIPSNGERVEKDLDSRQCHILNLFAPWKIYLYLCQPWLNLFFSVRMLLLPPMVIEIGLNWIPFFVCIYHPFSVLKRYVVSIASEKWAPKILESKKETRNRMLGVLLSKSFGNNS